MVLRRFITVDAEAGRAIGSQKKRDGGAWRKKKISGKEVMG